MFLANNKIKTFKQYEMANSLVNMQFGQMVESSFTNLVVVGSSPVTVTHQPIFVILQKLSNEINRVITRSIFSKYILNHFSTNVQIRDKPGNWFLLAKCLKKTCGRVKFQVKIDPGRLMTYIFT